MGDSLLDLFSTSATPQCQCIYGAPLIYTPGEGGKATLGQTCCNHWDCPRCGPMRARYEYGRIVTGARKLHEQGITLYMMTITCRGDVSREEAERDYLANTKKLNDKLRLRQVRAGVRGGFIYAVCVERQTRGHPHSHYLTNYVAEDAVSIVGDYSSYTATVSALNSRLEAALRFAPRSLDECSEGDLHSTSLMLASLGAGLGVQSAIAEITDVEGASRYIAKYLFKDALEAAWPSGWKRVRYSQNWPKFEPKSTGKAFALIRKEDWQRALKLNERVECMGEAVLIKALKRGMYKAYAVTPNGDIVSASNVKG